MVATKVMITERKETQKFDKKKKQLSTNKKRMRRGRKGRGEGMKLRVIEL